MGGFIVASSPSPKASGNNDNDFDNDDDGKDGGASSPSDDMASSFFWSVGMLSLSPYAALNSDRWTPHCLLPSGVATECR